MATITPRRNGSNGTVNSNYNASVVDAVGVQILPPVKTFGARGLTPKWGYDKNGLIVENGWSAKIDLYRTINDINALTSNRVEAIDKRVVTLVIDAKTYLLALQGYVEAEKELDALYELIPTVFTLAGQPVIAKGAGFVGKMLKPDNYKIIIQQLQKKLIHFEGEVKALEVLKSSLTGEYTKFDKVVNESERSANLYDNWVWVALGLIVLYILIKRKQA